jgi:hypothetical protein
MPVQNVLRFWFYPVYNNTSVVQTHHYTYTFNPAPIVRAVIYLNVFSGGIDFDNKVVGLAAAGVKAYTYLDGEGNTQTVDLTGEDVRGGLTVERLTSVTWFLSVQKAWAAAHGVVYKVG